MGNTTHCTITTIGLWLDINYVNGQVTISFKPMGEWYATNLFKPQAP